MTKAHYKLEDYQSDIDKLTELFLKDIENRKQFLELWITEVRKYDEPELHLLTLLLSPKITKQYVNDLTANYNNVKHFEKLKTKSEDKLFRFEDFKRNLATAQRTPPSEAYKLLLEMDKDLRSYQKKKPYPFTKVNPNFLFTEIRWNILKHAEMWAIDHNYIDASGKWIRAKIYLAAFLDILIEKKVLSQLKSMRPDIDQYFTKRYKIEILDSQFREGKIKLSGKKSESDFFQLSEEISKAINNS